MDEYQDINAAQDKIIQALSRDDVAANRFLVGDVKQSIYRFRLADPKIFRAYAKTWRGGDGQTIPLAENFRSRESLTGFVNSVFELLMREQVGGVDYDAEARLQFGAPEQRAALGLGRNPSPRTELWLRLKNNPRRTRRTMTPATMIWPPWKKAGKRRGSSPTGCANWLRKATKSGTRRTPLNARSNGAIWPYCCGRPRENPRFTRRNSSAPACRWWSNAADFMTAWKSPIY